MKPRPFPWNGHRRAYLVRARKAITELEPRVRAFTHLDTAALEAAGREPSSPLRGMPVAVKEIIDVAGSPVTFGTRVHAGRTPATDAKVVHRLREAGATVIGMTTTTPLACGTTTVTDNPVAPGHTPGGSSAGSAAAVAAGFAPVALASQSQASTLRPASYCGVWGFKPTHGRLPRDGMLLLSDTLDDVGVLAASWADLVTVWSVLGGDGPDEDTRSDRPGPAPEGSAPVPPALDPPRLGVLRLDDGGLPSPRTRAAFDGVLDRLARLCPLERASPSLERLDDELAGSGQHCFTILCCESAEVVSWHVQAGELDPRFTEMLDRAASAGHAGLRASLEQRERLRARWAELSAHVDAFVSLATTNPAPYGHASTGCRRLPATASLLGVPAVSAPWMSVDGRPLGVQLIGFEGRDEDLLQVAGWLDRRLRSAATTDPAREPAPTLTPGTGSVPQAACGAEGVR